MWEIKMPVWLSVKWESFHKSALSGNICRDLIGLSSRDWFANEWNSDLKQDTFSQAQCFLRTLCCPLVDTTVTSPLAQKRQYFKGHDEVYGSISFESILCCILIELIESDVDSKQRAYTYAADFLNFLGKAEGNSLHF